MAVLGFASSIVTGGLVATARPIVRLDHGEDGAILVAMSTRSHGTPLSLDERVGALMTTVQRLLGDRREGEAERLLAEAGAAFPDHPLVLEERARRLLAVGNASGARGLLERLVAVAPAHVTHWLSLAAVLRRLQEHEAELAALERALALDPTHLVVLLQKGALLDLMGKPRTAAAVYGHALQTLGPDVSLPAPIQAHVAHARNRVAENAARIAAIVEARLADVQPSAAGPAERMRFDRCLDRMLGRRRIYVPDPSSMLFPYLANYEFYPREAFPWIERLEAQTEAIRQELLEVLSIDAPGIEPYISFEAGLPVNQFRDLNHSRRWGAYFLWNQGKRVDQHCAQCPRTVAALAELPQVDIPDRGPTAFFSILEPRTKIPAHTGVTNTRLTVHLPLIVPAGCGFRVGGETREWQVGKAWVFDDTIEHEAWNDSSLPRAILIFDIWHSQLTPLERDLVRETTVLFAAYNDAERKPRAGPA
jgi:aspartyl/asparaginyl beta-hydroxylase (cupin superfamily)/Flp pilus assembly protein TadD